MNAIVTVIQLMPSLNVNGTPLASTHINSLSSKQALHENFKF